MCTTTIEMFGVFKISLTNAVFDTVVILWKYC